MAGRDPSMYEFCVITANEEASINFAKRVGLLLSDQQLQQQQQQQQQQQCLIGTAGCQGVVHSSEVFKRDRNKSYNIFRCNKCKKTRTTKAAIVQGEIRGARRSNEFRSFFATVNNIGKSQTKLPIQGALGILFCWSKDLALFQTKAMLGSLALEMHTYIDWRNFIREVCLRSLRNAPPMGGFGEVVQIDESLMRGRRKNNRGRMLLGNAAPAARNNYGQHVVGPWVFGLVWKRPDGTQDLRMFHVLRRNERTLRPIIERNVAPGTEIMSDQWAAYRNIANWNGPRYFHSTVNHDQYFVDPMTGANTQRIESHWGHVKTHLLRKSHGTTANLLPSHLAEYWWKKIHHKSPFRDIIREISQQFPLL